MYWLRSISILALVGYGILSLAWMVGGWLLASHAFRLSSRQRLTVGLAIGWVLFVVVSNLCAYLMLLPWNFWVASVLILSGGVLLAWRSAPLPRWLDWRDLRAWQPLVCLAGLVYVFALIQRGLAIFDDYLHLPVVSLMAAGDIPPHFYLNSNLYFGYHYGLQVWAASLVRVAGFFPWSAWDLSKAVALAFTLVLGWQWIWHLLRSRKAAYLGSLLITFGGGARWLLLLLPAALLAKIQGSIHLVNTGADTASTLVTALASPWVIEGGGSMPFPFAFQNGVFEPLISILGSTGAMPFLTIILMLILFPNWQLSWGGGVVATLLFASLALNAEHLFAFLWSAIALVLLVVMMSRRYRPTGEIHKAALRWLLVLAVSALLSLVQGGYITETARAWLASIFGQAAAQTNVYQFTLRWPPGFNNAHLGDLSPFNLGQLVVLLFVFLIQYGVDRRITRLTQTSLWVFMCLAIPVIYLLLRRRNQLLRAVVVSGYIAAVFGGLVTFAVQMTAAVNPQLSYYITGTDAGFSRQFWNQLGEDERVLDRIPERAAALFARSPQSSSDIYTLLPEYTSLINDPDPARVVQAGFRYIYMDKTWWEKLSPELRQSLQQSCVQELAASGEVDWRKLLDVKACR
jgi:hypothetical protein